MMHVSRFFLQELAVQVQCLANDNDTLTSFHYITAGLFSINKNKIASAIIILDLSFTKIINCDQK